MAKCHLSGKRLILLIECCSNAPDVLFSDNGFGNDVDGNINGHILLENISKVGLQQNERKTKCAVHLFVCLFYSLFVCLTHARTIQEKQNYSI